MKKTNYPAKAETKQVKSHSTFTPEEKTVICNQQEQCSRWNNMVYVAYNMSKQSRRRNSQPSSELPPILTTEMHWDFLRLNIDHQMSFWAVYNFFGIIRVRVALT